MNSLQPKKLKFVKIEPDIAEILRTRIQCDGANLRITGQRLDPALYKRVDTILKAIGGKWTSGKTQAHVFSGPANEIVAAALGDGKVLNKKQSYQFFETPEDIADRLVSLADIRPGMLVLEPSAGKGAIIRAIRRASHPKQIVAVELDKTHADALKDLDCVYIYGDFLTTKLGREGFDRIVMNPPFSGNQDAAHIMHAFNLLNPGGRLVSVVGEGICTRKDSLAVEFQSFMDEAVVLEEELDNGAFATSGTNSKSRIIVLE